MSKKKPTLSPYVTESEKKWFADRYGRPNTGAGLAISSFPFFYTQAILELKEVFTRQEIIAITDCLNGVMFQPMWGTRPEALMANLSDFEELENGISRHETDPKALIDKIKSLSVLAVYFLQDEISLWWKSEPAPKFDELFKTIKIKADE